MRRCSHGLALLLLVSFLVGCASNAAPSSSGQPAAAAPRAAPPTESTAGGGSSTTSAPEIVVPPTQVRASYSVVSGGITLYWIAADTGLWKRHGLDVDFVSIAGTPPSMAALISGETQFAVASGDAVLRVQAQNPDVVSVLTTTTGNTHRLMAGPHIQKVEDLRGGRLGTAAIGDGAYAITSKALLKLGINPQSDVTWVATGGGNTAAMIAGLVAGAFDATPLTAPNDLIAARHGAHSVLDVADLNLPAAGLAINVQRRTLEQQRAVVEAFLAGVIDAVRLAQEDPELGKSILSQRMGLNDPEAIDWAYRTYGGQQKPIPLYLNHAEVRAVIEDLAPEYPELRQVDVDRVLDNSVLRDLEAKGYFTH